MTVNISEGTACCVVGFVPSLREDGYFYTTLTSRIIRRTGQVQTVNVTSEISVRRTICRGSFSDIIYVYPHFEEDHYVFMLNTETPNIISVQKITKETSKISMNPTGTVKLVHSVNSHFFLNLSPEFLSYNTTRVVEFLDLEKFLDGKNRAWIDIRTTAVKNNKLIRLL